MLGHRQGCLGLFVLCCIHVLSSWSWSAILFVADPLLASTIQTHKGGTSTRRLRRKPAHLVMTKAFKASSDSQILCMRAGVVLVCAIQPIATASGARKKDTLRFWQRMLFAFLLDLEVGVAPAKWSESVKRLPVDMHDRNTTSSDEAERKDKSFKMGERK